MRFECDVTVRVQVDADWESPEPEAGLPTGAWMPEHVGLAANGNPANVLLEDDDVVRQIRCAADEVAREREDAAADRKEGL